MKRILFQFVLLLMPTLICMAQENKAADSASLLPSVLVSAFEQNRPLLSANATVSVLSVADADRYNKSSLVNAFNTVAGARMEERSPGSYRINIRGSSLRAPFGVRNVKVYWNNIPITDPGGNSYFNEFALNNFNSIEIYKGPAGSMYGAGTGGLIIMHSIDRLWKPGAQLDYVTGNFGLQNILGTFAFGKEGSQNNLSYAHTESNGYRDHTRSRKDNASFVSHISFSEKQELTASVLFASLYYQTPGGLNLAEYKANPRQARPAAGGFPSAEQARAAIFQKNIVAGLTHQYRFGNYFSNSTTVYAAFAQIRNPTFRNYERRNEPHFGGRSQFVFNKKIEKNNIQVVAGAEWQQGYFNTQVSQNRNGNPDTLQTNDDIRFTSYSIFVQGDLSIRDDIVLTAGASSNKSDVLFTRLNQYPVLDQHRSYQNEWSPRIAILKKIGKDHALLASVSKGFSPPTIAELLPSTGTISTYLESEKGINYELGARTGLLKNQLRAELNLFYFKINDALVQRKDSSNADYYVNAGNTSQKGIELSLAYNHFFRGAHAFLESISIQAAQSLNHFVYGDYQKGTSDLSGKFLPSVPDYTLSVAADLQSNPGFYLSTILYAASRIYLTDDNKAFAPAYQVLGARIGWKMPKPSNMHWNIYAGADNLLNEKYSLGNDINAAGGRYYNAAPRRNYYVGLGWRM